MNQPLNPEQIEAGIREVSNRIADSVKVCSERYKLFLAEDHAYDIAYARAYLGHPGPAHEKRFAAELATKAERAAKDVADAAYRYADRKARALENELRALQSVGASIRAMYAIAGRGEGA